MERAFKGIWIPKEIWLDDNLNWVEKILLVEIDSLDNEEGCFASNAYFANFFKLSKRRISELISSLNGKGYITIKLEYKEGTKQVERRIVKSCYTYSGKLLGAMEESNYTPMEEKCEDNNISFNNTINNNDDDDDEQAQKTQNVHLFYQQNFGVESPIIQEDLNYWLDDLNEELVIEALKRAAFNNKEYSYAKTIMQKWAKKNIKTMEQVKAEDVSFERSHSGYRKKNTPPPRTKNNNIHF